MDAIALIDHAAPDFNLTDLDGNTHQLSHARGAILVVIFWSADCPHSSAADRTLQPLRDRWGEQVQVWSIASNANETLPELRAAAQERSVPTVLHDADQQVARDYGAVSTPQVFVIDEGGRLRFSGAFDDVSLRQRQPTTNHLERAVESLLAGEAPDPPHIPPFGCAVVWAE